MAIFATACVAAWTPSADEIKLEILHYINYLQNKDLL